MWGGARRFRRSELEALVRAAGLRVQRLTYANTLLFPVAAASRLLARAGVGGGNDLHPLPPALINALLRRSGSRSTLAALPRLTLRAIIAVRRRASRKVSMTSRFSSRSLPVWVAPVLIFLVALAVRCYRPDLSQPLVRRGDEHLLGGASRPARSGAWACR